MIDLKRIALLYDSSSPAATEAFEALSMQNAFVKEDDMIKGEIDLIVAIGGDGLMLKILHRYMDLNCKFYGINRGSIGFLMNHYNPKNLLEKLNNAIEYKLAPLEMTVTNIHDKSFSQLAINEVSILRETNQAARIRIIIDDMQRLDMLVCDGVLLSTPAGSTAYNFAADGPILPLDANLLCMTPIAPFRPRRWRGALISNKAKIKFENIDPYKRPISASADYHEFREIKSVEIKSCNENPITILFDPESSIEDRLLKEMFIP